MSRHHLIPIPFPVVVGLAVALLASLGPVKADTVHAAEPAPQFRVSGTEGAALRLRDRPSLAAPIIARLPEGAVVTLSQGVATEADGERWLPMQSGPTRGWAAARYLVRVVPQSPIVRPLPSNATFADRVTATAQAALGQPYVWAGNAPGGFDCSGLVQWVYNQVGLRMPRVIPDQLAVGKSVDRSALQPGDLVSFKNTYREGLSHVGVYVGGNRFVHAADEAQGVTISNLQDAYWKPRFHQAVRPSI